jgi:hypothetical protein
MYALVYGWPKSPPAELVFGGGMVSIEECERKTGSRLGEHAAQGHIGSVGDAVRDAGWSVEEREEKSVAYRSEKRLWPMSFFAPSRVIGDTLPSFSATGSGPGTGNRKSSATPFEASSCAQCESNMSIPEWRMRWRMECGLCGVLTIRGFVGGKGAKLAWINAVNSSCTVELEVLSDKEAIRGARSNTYPLTPASRLGRTPTSGEGG